MRYWEAGMKDEHQLAEEVTALRAENERLTAQNTFVAGFLEGLANRMDGFRREEQCAQAAADCRAMAAKLRGENMSEQCR